MLMLPDGKITSETDTTTTDTEAEKARPEDEKDSPDNKKRKKLRKTRKKIKWSTLDRRKVNSPKEYYPIFYTSPKKHRTFALFNNFVSRDEIVQIHTFCTDPSVKNIEDRSNNLTYTHLAFRVEHQARKLGSDLYDKLLNAVKWTDSEIWKKLPATVYPELEYIVYDRALHGGKPGYIEEHVDNKSAVTFVLMLSDPREYNGGVNYFARSGKHGVPRSVQLQQGDMVVFRGERLLHWISPVVGGRRIILQGEMSRV